MVIYAEVAVNAPIRQTFSYHVPLALDGKIRPGHLVRVSFGKAREPGIVLALHTTSPVEVTKPIEARLDPLPVVTALQIKLAQFISETYLAPIGMCLWLFLPPGIAGQSDSLLTLRSADFVHNPLRDDDLEVKIISLLHKRGALRLGQIKQSIKDPRTEKTVKRLVSEEILDSEAVLSPPRVKPKTIQTASLTIHPSTIPDMLRLLGHKSRRADVLETIVDLAVDGCADLKTVLAASGATRATLKRLQEDEGLVTIEDQRVCLTLPLDAVDSQLVRLRRADTDVAVLRVLARENSALDVSWLYAQTGAALNDLKRLAELDLITLGEKEIWRDSLADRDFVPVSAPVLTVEQERVWREIARSFGQQSCFLLHGVTGSGKTEIYLRAIETAIAQGKQAFFLVPEISLTAQTIRRVAARFPGKVAILHSKLSDGERYDTWRRAREGLIQVIVGARSALFTPLPNVGVIILDEEHDASFKSQAHPVYDARSVAEEMARLNNAVLILGSATPDVVTYYRAQRGDLTYLHLPNRIMGHRVRLEEQAERSGLQSVYRPDDSGDALTIDLPPVTLVDMREELQSGNTSIFSRALHTALSETLQRREQAILFLNRRGRSTYVFCRDCGYIAKCPRCDTPLTYHDDSESLHCHHCGHYAKTPTTCPECKSRRIKFFGAGTQQVEIEFKKLFPQVRVVRWDADTASNPDMHDQILQRFMTHDADVMVGTQMIAKGLDIPRVTLVGVVSADTGLAMPDFRTCERTFQLLTQVAGRAGRGLLGGQVILQTYQPGNYAIAAASNHDYETFYAKEIAYRRDLGYPPFRRLARVLIQNENQVKAKDDAARVAGILRQRITDQKLTGTEIIGPAPCFFGRLNRIYRWQILVRGANPEDVLQHLDIARGWTIEIDPADLL